MKKMIAWTLVAVMALGVFMSPVYAVQQTNGAKQITEDPRRGGGRYRPRPDRHRNRRSNSGWGWAVGGAIVGSAIGAAIANSNNSSSNNYYYGNGGYYYRSAEPVLVCDQYGNCYYTYQ